MSKVVTLLLVGLVLAATGCVATLPEMRAQQPGRVLNAPGRMTDLAGCFAAGVQASPSSRVILHHPKLGDLRLETVRRDDVGVMTVTGVHPVATMSKVPVFDVTFQQVGNQVRIEERWQSSGPDVRAPAQAIVDRCVQEASR